MQASSEVKQILDITRKAGELLKKLSQDPGKRKPQTKSDGSPVTAADLEVSDFLVKNLGTLGWPVVSEEALPENPPSSEQPYLLVDPLDGTKYFSRGKDEFAVCVGFLKGGVPYAGAIYDPTRSTLYWAERGVGAFRDEQPINHPGPGEKLRVYSSGFHKKPEKKFIVDSLNIGDIREKGSALKFCDIAAQGSGPLYALWSDLGVGHGRRTSFIGRGRLCDTRGLHSRDYDLRQRQILESRYCGLSPNDRKKCRRLPISAWPYEKALWESPWIMKPICNS
jgi:3'(2'), 5'-bisphosphate nucleotidase